MSQVEVKGQSIRATLQVIEELWGDQVANEVTTGATGEFATALQTGSITFSGWYPIAWYAQIHDQLARALPPGVDFARMIGRTTTERDLSGIYRFILSLTTPSLIARHFDKIVASYLRGGTVHASAHPKSFNIQGHGWVGMSPSLWREAVGGIETIFEHTGAKHVTASFRGIPGEDFDVDLRWQ